MERSICQVVGGGHQYSTCPRILLLLPLSFYTGAATLRPIGRNGTPSDPPRDSDKEKVPRYRITDNMTTLLFRGVSSYWKKSGVKSSLPGA